CSVALQAILSRRARARPTAEGALVAANIARDHAHLVDDRSLRSASPLSPRVALVVILLSSFGLWGAIWLGLAAFASAWLRSTLAALIGLVSSGRLVSGDDQEEAHARRGSFPASSAPLPSVVEVHDRARGHRAVARVGRRLRRRGRRGRASH